TVTAIQRFGSGLQLNVHFHTLVLDGAFSHTRSGPLTFHPAPPLSDADVAHILAIVRARVGRLLARPATSSRPTIRPRRTRWPKPRLPWAASSGPPSR